MKPRALIVDDDAAECDLLADVLEDAGFEPHCTLRPARALHLVYSQRFDVVLTDNVMPEMSGTELCSLIKQLKPYLPVVIVTAFGGFALAAEAAQAGAAEFVAKPFDIDTIGDVLRRAMKSVAPSTDHH
ncbi:MAG TPA: response regulator [Polyangiaceae bacterium]|nr:response regulator [Polyangiaceae bacterium]